MARVRQSLIIAPLAVLCLWSTSLTTLSWRQARGVERMPFAYSGRIVEFEQSSFFDRLIRASVVEVALSDAEGETFVVRVPDHSILRPFQAGDTTTVRSNVGELYGPKRKERLRAALAALSTTAATEETSKERRQIRAGLGREETLQLAHRRSLWDPVWEFGLLALGSFGALMIALPRKQAQRAEDLISNPTM